MGSSDGLKSDLINRLQARLDEEEFGMIDDVGITTPTTTTTTEATTDVAGNEGTTAEVVEGSVTETKSNIENTMTPKESNVTVTTTTTTATTIINTSQDNTTTGKTETTSLSNSKKKETDQEKNKRRAERFGIPLKETDQTLLEKKKERAARFGIPLKESIKKEERALRFGIPLVDHKNNNNNNNKRKSNDNKSLSNTMLMTGRDGKKFKESDDGLLPRDEIEKRLARAEKFSLGQDAIDKYKAMLRQYRFSG